MGAVLSFSAAALLSFAILSAWIPRLVSFAVGVLLGSAFLHLLPEAFMQTDDIERLFMVAFGGVLAFFLLEKALLWRHCHHSPEAQSAGGRRPVGALILLGDGFHNFLDGVLIAAAFLADVTAGIAATIAIIVHEVPQEVGDFLILRHAGYTRRRALLLNLASSCAAVAGGLVGYIMLDGSRSLVPYMLALAAASFIYIALTDLIPHLHERPDASSAAWQIALITVGAGMIGGMYAVGHGH